MELTEKEITGAVAKRLRETHGLTQSAFWEPIGVQQSVGCRYESEAQTIPLPVRILLLVVYVAGLQVDAQTIEGVKQLASLGKIQAKFALANKAAANAVNALDDASKRIAFATSVLEQVKHIPQN